MNINQRLDLVAKALPKPPAKANPFSEMTDDELDKLTRELAELVQTELDKDPTAIKNYDPKLITLLTNEGLLNYEQ